MASVQESTLIDYSALMVVLLVIIAVSVVASLLLVVFICACEKKREREQGQTIEEGPPKAESTERQAEVKEEKSATTAKEVSIAKTESISTYQLDKVPPFALISVKTENQFNKVNAPKPVDQRSLKLGSETSSKNVEPDESLKTKSKSKLENISKKSVREPISKSLMLST